VLPRNPASVTHEQRIVRASSARISPAFGRRTPSPRSPSPRRQSTFKLPAGDGRAPYMFCSTPRTVVVISPTVGVEGADGRRKRRAAARFENGRVHRLARSTWPLTTASRQTIRNVRPNRGRGLTVELVVAQIPNRPAQHRSARTRHVGKSDRDAGMRTTSSAAPTRWPLCLGNVDDDAISTCVGEGAGRSGSCGLFGRDGIHPIAADAIRDTCCLVQLSTTVRQGAAASLLSSRISRRCRGLSYGVVDDRCHRSDSKRSDPRSGATRVVWQEVAS
jgi:hypothetical protein